MANQRHSSFLFPDSGFNDLRLEGTFCDAVITVEDVEFKIHKIFLCRCSLYFEALFQRWSSPDKKVYNIPGLTPDMMQLLIDYAYTGSVSVTEDNVRELLLAADQFNVMGVVKKCCDFLESQLCPENCIGIFQFTTAVCFCPELHRQAYSFIIDHFEELVFTEEFLQLSVQQLSAILKRDDLRVRDERTVYEAVRRWIAHSLEERRDHIAVLLSKVRLASMGTEYMRISVMSNELVNNNTECQRMVREAIEVMQNQPDVYHHLARPRLPNAVLLAIGGWSGGNTTAGIEAYNVHTNDWISLTQDLERPRAFHGTAFLNGSVYCVGGCERLERLNSVCRFDLGSKTWHEVSPMFFHRCFVSVTTLNGCIYAMGGYDRHQRLSTAERYNPETNQWSLISSMQEVRSSASSTTLHNKVYVCGGSNGNEFLQTAECYNPETDQWTTIGLMTCARSGLGIITYADRLYAVGGFDGTSRLSSAEFYDPRSNTWNQVSHMLTPRSNFGIEVIDDRIFVVGGHNGIAISTNVECYNVTTGEWSEVSDMGIGRSALSCCVVSGLPNMAQYLVPRDVLPLLDLDSVPVESVEAGRSV